MPNEVVEKGADVVRSQAPTGMKYQDYKPLLRRDFFFSCAYCTMSESEATAIRFTIDHYESQKHRPDLINEYENLLYCCDECNTRKGARLLSEKIKNLGYRIFRPDWDQRERHFSVSELRVEGKTAIGEFTIDAVALNRSSLRRLRDLRRRLTECEEYVAGGVHSLRKFPMDGLPKEIKARAFRAVKDASSAVQGAAEEIDELLRMASKSPLDGGDSGVNDIKEDKERLKRLKAISALHPEVWRRG
ncbi:HNH endonuclease [Nitratireductor mangrovi]|uniref:HNH endonuclease n=1 Tax=Nitratireductor mangrovi TaxID=2599600 RepID=A0A5B8L2E6_9HYPH|nr:HNH endonuclease [Nitratireductor mangrovi]QDZ02111.1 HNH endonuclease [Nitratireductor mangrovi]